MIDIEALRNLVEKGEPRVVVDATGAIADRGERFGVGDALLIVVPPTDAVKVVAGGLVHDSLDRDTMWSIEGFVLGREVVLSLDRGLTTPGELIDAVTRAGFEWQLSRPSSSSP
ncbi:MAG: hypothetical protein WD895_10625 [Acidimicrobiia bacterium]